MTRLWSVCALLVVALSLQSCGGDADTRVSDPASITSFLQAAVDRGDVPGMVAMVVNREGVVYHEAFGRQDVGRDIPMAKDSIFRIASMTKPITSIAIMMLVDEGRLGLDDEASRWVPAMAGRAVLTSIDTSAGTYETRPAARPITIRQLLTHTSGIGYTWSDPGLALVQKLTNPQEDALPLVHEPGEDWTYGSSTRVLGDIVEAISGQRIDAFLRTRIFEPLGMHDTFFEVPTDRYTRVVTTHQRVDRAFKETPNPETLPVQLRADGGLLSTADDYGRFIRMLLNGGELEGTRLLFEETVRDIGRNHMGDVVVRLQPSNVATLSRPYPLGAGADTWGLGFQRAAAPPAPHLRSEGSLAWAGIFNTQFSIDPSRGLGAILLMQYLPFFDGDAIETLQGFEQLVNEHLGTVPGS